MSTVWIDPDPYFAAAADLRGPLNHGTGPRADAIPDVGHDGVDTVLERLGGRAGRLGVARPSRGAARRP